MTAPIEATLPGARHTIQTYTWENPNARYVAVLSHGYAEHARRYDHVAAALVDDGAAVLALDHHGHGRSEGERALVRDEAELTADLDALIERAREAHPQLPLVLIGHSMGGLVATRYAQTHPDKLSVLVLSGPVIGRPPAFQMLLDMDPIPDIPIDPAMLSRDPAVGAAYHADELVYRGAFRRETLEALFAAIDAVARGGPIEVPTLWIHGEHDMLAPLDAVRPGAEAIRSEAWQSKVYPGAMHEIFNETNRDEVIADVIGFIHSALDGAPSRVSRPGESRS